MDPLSSLTYAFEQIQKILSSFFPDMICINARMWSHASVSQTMNSLNVGRVRNRVEDHWRSLRYGEP